MTKTRALLIAVRVAVLAAAVRAGMVCDNHHLPLLLTLCLCAFLIAVLDQTLTDLIYRERTLTCPDGCGLTITATREDADQQKALLQTHQRTAHTTADREESAEMPAEPLSAYEQGQADLQKYHDDIEAADQAEYAEFLDELDARDAARDSNT